MVRRHVFQLFVGEFLNPDPSRPRRQRAQSTQGAITGIRQIRWTVLRQFNCPLFEPNATIAHRANFLVLWGHRGHRG